MVEAAHHPRRLPGQRRFSVGSAVPLGARGGEGGRRTLGAGSALRAVIEVSGLRDRGGTGRAGNLFRKLYRPLQGEGRGERVAGGAGVELRACKRPVDAADHAGKSAVRGPTAQRGALKLQPILVVTNTPSTLYRGRLAPSPTGLLHVGHARTFWMAAQRAAERGGTLIFRNEDLDPQRCRPEFVEAMIGDLRWLGISWSEGPDCGGPFAPYTQSQRRGENLDAWEERGGGGGDFCS